MGLHRAGFEVTGVDIKPQKRFPFHFIQGDALDADLSGYDFVWASPPCQRHCDLNRMYNRKEHPDLIPPTRAKLVASGLPYIIENVEGAPLLNPVTLCGTMFGSLGTGSAELWRHRLFESNMELHVGVKCQHRLKPRVIGVYGGHGRDRRRTVNTKDFSTTDRRLAMGIDWMTGNELSQAIPPAYSEFLGRQVIGHIKLHSKIKQLTPSIIT